MSQKAKRIL